MAVASTLARPADPHAKTPKSPEILAVVADAESVSTLENLATLDRTAPIQIARGNIRDAAKLLTRLPRSPRLLIVDVAGVDLPLTAVDALADACEPGVRVIVVGETHDIGLFRELMRLGVTDYLVKPILPDLISPYLTGGDAITSVQHNRTGKVVAIAGARGGVGATTIATAVGGILANVHHRRILLVDLDPFGGAMSVQLNVTTGGLSEALDNADQLDALFLERALVAHGPRLFVLGDDHPFTEDHSVDPVALEALLQTLEQQFHYIIVDLPRRPGSTHAALLRRAGIRMLVADRTVPSVRDVTRMLSAVDGTSGRTLLVLNDGRPNGDAAASKDLIEDSLGRPFDIVVPFDKSLPRLVDNLGESAVEGRGAFAMSMRDLAAALMGQRLAGKPKGLLQLIKGR